MLAGLEPGKQGVIDPASVLRSWGHNNPGNNLCWTPNFLGVLYIILYNYLKKTP